ncbi:MAG TPA: hypothetical protein VJ302_23950 [Blastocatellia bacterium]|nr:hypothetical protein [Blastocatellia bacterium]
MNDPITGTGPTAADPARRDDECGSLPDLTRLRYFHGQLLGAHDLQTEQSYFREKLKMLNRCLQGYGTVCGLQVVSCEDGQQADAADAKDESRPDAPRLMVTIECGLALDSDGNELVVKYPIKADLWKELSDEDRKLLHDALDHSKPPLPPLYVSICYCVQPLEPVRPVLPDACGAISECIYSKLRDAVRVTATFTKPHDDTRCETCCQACRDRCLPLAAVWLKPRHGGKGVEVERIDNSIRRWLATYEPTTITGVNWTHAGIYEPDDVEHILRSGLVIEFSREISAEWISEGVIDVLVYEGGKGRHAGLYFLDGEVSVYKNRLIFKQTSDEELQDGDRISVVLRTDFILDHCCRPVDGNHVGGKVPLLKDYAKNARKPRWVHGSGTSPGRCDHPPRRYGAWTSGNGTAGGTFESWLFAVKKGKGGGRHYDPQDAADESPAN